MDLLTHSLPYIEHLQKMKGLIPLMKFLSILGTEYFYLALLPIIYWGVSRPLGVRLGALLIFSVIVNEIFKVGFAQPRPYWLDPQLLLGEKENSFGLPSGHAQNAFLIWLFLAMQSSNRKLWVPLAILLALSISFSRIFLGVHFPTDCVGGAVIGLVILGFYRGCGPAWMRFWHQLSVGQKLFLAICSTLFLAGAYSLGMVLGASHVNSDYGQPSLTAVQNAMDWYVIAPRLGAFFGLVTAAAFAARFVHFEARATVKPLVIRYVLGFLILCVIYFGAAKAFPEGPGWRFLRYAMVSFWVVFGAPWLFGKLRLDGRSDQLTPLNG